MFDVAEWFNDFVAVVEGVPASQAATTPRQRKGRRRLSTSTPVSTAASVGTALDEGDGRRGRKRKAAAPCVADATDSGLEAHGTVAPAAEEEDCAACSDGGSARRGRGSSAMARSLRARAGEQARGQRKGVRWAADDGEMGADSDDAEDGITGQLSPRPTAGICCCFATLSIPAILSTLVCSALDCHSITDVAAQLSFAAVNGGVLLSAGDLSEEDSGGGDCGVLAPARRGRRNKGPGKGVRRDSLPEKATPKVQPVCFTLGQRPEPTKRSGLLASRARLGPDLLLSTGIGPGLGFDQQLQCWTPHCIHHAVGDSACKCFRVLTLMRFGPCPRR